MQNQQPQTPYTIQPSVANAQSATQTPITNGNSVGVLPMKFHNFYSIALIVCGSFSVLTAIASLFLENVEFAGILSFIMAIYMIIEGILLFKRKKVGNVMRLIGNIYGIVTHIGEIVLGIGTAIICLFGKELLEQIGDELLNEIGGLINVFGIIFAAVCIIAGITGIIINALIIKYYKKRKIMFN